MALTLKRWLTIVVLACAAIAVWQLPADGGSAARRLTEFRGRYVPGHGYVRRHGWPDASTKLGSATLHLRLLEIRDSVFTPRVMAAADSGLTVLTDRQFPDSVATIFQTVIRNAWTASRPGRRDPVLIAVVQDTTKAVDGLPVGVDNSGIAHVFPPDSSAAACRVVVRIRSDLAHAALKSARRYAQWMVLVGGTPTPAQNTILGPCWLYATYGAPGPRVAAWLTATDWRAARTVEPNRQSPMWLPAFRENDFGWWMQAQTTMLVPDVAWLVRPRLSNDGVACVAGNAARCAAGVQAPTPVTPQDSAWRARVIDLDSYAMSYGTAPEGALGPASGWMLSDMIHDLGPKRFASFWQSSDSVPVAFEAAAQEPFGTWLHAWATRTYGTDVVGPSIERRGLVAGLAALVLGLLVAMGFARERRVA